MEGESSTLKLGRETSRIPYPNNEDTLKPNNSESTSSLCSAVLLDDSKILIWQRAMRIALKSKGKIQYVKGRSKAPPVDLCNYWPLEKIDNMVFSWILSHISNDLIPTFIHSNTTREQWENLDERYGASNRPLINLE